MKRVIILSLALAAVASAQVNLLTEDFSSGAVPASFVVQAGTAAVSNGVLNLFSGCLQLAQTGGNKNFSRERGLSVSVDVTIQNGAQGDFNIWGLYDTLGSCPVGPVNGYSAGVFPAGSDNSVDSLTAFVNAVGTSLGTTPTSVAANTRFRVRQEFYPDGTIRLFVNNVLILSGTDSSRTSGFITLRTWQGVNLDNISVDTIDRTNDSSFQVRYTSNLNLSDSVINITNSGARGAGVAAGTSASTTGALCVNVYAFSPDEQMVSCCSCPVTPNGLVSLSARQDLISNTLTPAQPTSLVVKLYATTPVGGSCTSSAASPGDRSSGMLAFATTAHVGTSAGDIQITETPFAPASLSTGELSRLTQLCTFINANGSGFGICRSCRLGGLGAGRL